MTMTAALKKTRETKQRRAQLIELCSSLPEVDVSGEQHLAFKVRNKTFAYYLDDHHGDGKVALCCKAPPGEQSRLVERDPVSFFVPPYLGRRGWVTLRLDLTRVDWNQVAGLVVTAYRLTAPKQLVALTV